MATEPKEQTSVPTKLATSTATSTISGTTMKISEGIHMYYLVWYNRQEDIYLCTRKNVKDNVK